MHRLITLIWLLIAPPLWSELYVSPSSAYFGHVPAGYEELREIRVCGDIISRDNLQFLQISDPELNEIFQIIDQSWKNECLFLTIRFRPALHQGTEYQIYGLLPDGKKLYQWPEAERNQAGSRLQAVLSDRIIDLAPVMGTGVTQNIWDNVIKPSGWRYAGQVTYRKEVPEAYDKYLTFSSADRLQRTIIASTYDRKELIELRLNWQNIPVYSYPASNELSYELSYELNYDSQRDWVTVHNKRRLVATAGTRGGLSLWKRSRAEWQEDQISGKSPHYPFVNQHFRPVFNTSGRCLLMPDTNLKHLRRIIIPEQNDPEALAPYPLNFGVIGLSRGPDETIGFADENHSSIHECRLDNDSCQIFDCRTLPPTRPGKPYSTAFSADGRWLAAGYNNDGFEVRLWRRENGRVVEDQPQVIHGSSGWPALPAIQFHPDSRQLFVTSRQHFPKD